MEPRQPDRHHRRCARPSLCRNAGGADGERAVDAVLVLNCPTALGSPTAAAQAVIEAVRSPTSRNVYTPWLGDYWAAPARRLFAQARMPTYDAPDDAVQGFMHRVRHRRNQDLLMQVPPAAEAFAPDRNAARSAIDSALAADRSWLDAEEVSSCTACLWHSNAPRTVCQQPGSCCGSVARDRRTRCHQDSIG